MSLLDSIKNEVKKSGSNKGKFLYFKSGTKIRVRFLVDIDDGFQVKFHDSFAEGINVPCQEIFGKDCPYCDDDDLRTRDQYAWPVWDYEAKEVKILMAPVNQCSPVPALVSMYEAYGTLTDRDYVITKSGQQQSTTFSVVPMDKAKFRNEKAKPFSRSKFLSILAKAYPCESGDEDDDYDDDEDESPKKSKGKGKGKDDKKKKGNKKPKEDEWEDDDEDLDEEENDEWEDEEDDEDEVDYSEMSAKELYQLCKDRGIKCKPKQKEKVYIKLLEEADEDGEEDEDDWE